MTPKKTDSIETGVQAHEQGISPFPVTDLDEQTIGYKISISVVSQSPVESNFNATDGFVHYRIQEDVPELLLEADSLFKVLQSEFETSPVNRYSGEGFEIVVEPLTRDDDNPFRYQRRGNTQTFVVKEGDLPQVASEFFELANDSL